MTALRATWLTWKLHRTETIIAAVVMAAVAISAWVVTQRLQALSIPSGCWYRSAGEVGSDLCQRLLRLFDDITVDEARQVRGALLLAPVVIGAILGVSVVARELEQRTASLAWSLEGGRQRWLAQRAGAMALLLGIGLLAMGWLGAGFDAATHIPSQVDGVRELALQGLPLVSRGFAALGIGLLAGAGLGRTLPALLVAAVGVALLWAVGSFIMPPVVGGSMARWVDQAGRARGSLLLVLDEGLFDPAIPGVRGEPGARLDWNDANQRGLPVTCGPAPAPSADDLAYEACYSEYDPSMTLGWWLGIPTSARPIIEGAQVALDLLVTGGSIALTALVVARRRPE